MRKYISFAGLSLLIMAGACAGTEKTEETVAEIEAAQMEGRSAARIFVSREWKDTMQLQRNLLEARTIHGKYITAGKPHCAEAYDSAFISTVRTVNPDLARQLEK